MSTQKLRQFVQDLAQLLASHPDESTILAQGREQLATLVAQDDWLDDRFAQPHPQHYQQYLLYADPLDQFSIVSFVWGPGQQTPVHDHLTWGLIGMLRGSERETCYQRQADGSLQQIATNTLLPGQVAAVSPSIGDVHAVANGLDDQVSISIHVYGRNIGQVQRHVFDPQSGAAKTFVSGYASNVVPNLWA